jgi:RNA-directed DNA polymerase
VNEAGRRSLRGRDGGTSRRQHTEHEKPDGSRTRDPQPDAREGQAGGRRVADGFVVAWKPANPGGAKGPEFKDSAEATESPEIDVSLTTPPTVRKLQEALRVKAKSAPNGRFHQLYDKLYRADVLAFAYELCRANAGAPGIDRETFGEVETYGRDRWLGELAEALRTKTYRPQAVRRVWIPKADGKQRPLGIPTLKDRVVQTAAVLVLEPIFEEDLQPEQYAYRPGRSALDAVQAVHRLVSRGHTDVVDADLSGYFDTIPHHELMKSVARRVSDGNLLHLIRQWLEMPVEERDERGHVTRTTRNRDEGRGTPQGAPLSPLLANIYMRRFVLGWKTQGHQRRLNATIVNYADDFVICCRGTADQAMQAMRRIMQTLKLTVNETKTRIARLPEEEFQFLGYTIGTCYDRRTGRSRLGTRPAKKKIQSLTDSLSAKTDRGSLCRPVEEVVGDLNSRLRGWANYFRLGFVSPAYQAVHHHVCRRLRQWLRHKYRQQARGVARLTDDELCVQYGLVQLPALRRSYLHAHT